MAQDFCPRRRFPARLLQKRGMMIGSRAPGGRGPVARQCLANEETMAKRTPPPKQPQFDPYRGDVNYADASQKSPPSRGKPGSAAAARGGVRKRRVSLLALLAILLALAAAALAIIEKPVTISGKTIPPEPIKLPFPTEVKGLKIDGVLLGGAAAALGFITMLFAAGKRIGAKAPVLAFIGGIGAGVFAYMHSDKAPGTPARWVHDKIDYYMP